MVEELPAKQLVGNPGLQVQILCAAFKNDIGMCCNWKTGWSQKPAAIGHCGFDSHHVDFNYHIYFHQNLMQS